LVASCGDYVVLGASHGRYSRFHQPALSEGVVLADLGKSSEVEMLEEGGPGQSPVPCSDPECTRQRGPLPAAPAGAQEVTHEWCINCVLACIVPRQVSVTYQDVVAARLVRRASHIFHPPKFTWGWLAA